MARQGRSDEARRVMTIIAVDPGDRFNGIAAVELKGKKHSVWRTGTLESSDHLTLARFLDHVLGSTLGAFVAVEDFRNRPVGHQAFARPSVPRSTGAIEFMALHHKVPVVLIPPGNIKKDLEGFGMTKVVKWLTTGMEGDHASSAWRILCQTVLKHHTELEWLFNSRFMDHQWKDDHQGWLDAIDLFGGNWTKPVIMERCDADSRA